MASPAATPSILFLHLLVAFAAGAGAATFTITNRCSFTVWPGAIPVGGGTQLNPGQAWTLNVPAGTRAARIWPRTGCSFGRAGRGGCQTGDCAGALCCALSGKPPATLAEFTLGLGGAAADYYDISVVDGFNVPMDLSCSTGDALRCRDPGCPDANHHPNEGKIHTCKGNSAYQVVFCP